MAFFRSASDGTLLWFFFNNDETHGVTSSVMGGSAGSRAERPCLHTEGTTLLAGQAPQK
ncbi:hypothetical protein SB725_13930 [Pseudomonas sp. SIMBA_041]